MIRTGPGSPVFLCPLSEVLRLCSGRAGTSVLPDRGEQGKAFGNCSKNVREMFGISGGFVRKFGKLVRAFFGTCSENRPLCSETLRKTAKLSGSCPGPGTKLVDTLPEAGANKLRHHAGFKYNQRFSPLMP